MSRVDDWKQTVRTRYSSPLLDSTTRGARYDETADTGFDSTASVDYLYHVGDVGIVLKADLHSSFASNMAAIAHARASSGKAHREHARSPAQAACPSCSPDVTPSLCRHLGRWTAMGSWSRDITEGSPVR